MITSEEKQIIYTAINDMCKALKENKIEYVCKPTPYFFGAQFTFPNIEGDVICHDGSYGHELGLFESYHFPWDEGDVTGYLTIEDFIEKFRTTYCAG